MAAPEKYTEQWSRQEYVSFNGYDATVNGLKAGWVELLKEQPDVNRFARAVDRTTYSVGITKWKGRKYFRVGCVRLTERAIRKLALELDLKDADKFSLDDLERRGFPVIEPSPYW